VVCNKVQVNLLQVQVVARGLVHFEADVWLSFFMFIFCDSIFIFIDVYLILLYLI